MNNRGLVVKTAFVFIAAAVLLIGFSAKPSQAVQTQASPIAQPTIELSNAMNQTKQEDTTHRERQIECLARNMYFEARGESTAGQLAVGQVTINRVGEKGFPRSICGVVNQRSQFSWVGKQSTISQPRVYKQIYAMAELLYEDYYQRQKFPDLVDGATHFHTSAVNPQWRGKLLVVRIGNHNFYKVNQG